MASACLDAVVWKWFGNDNMWHCYNSNISNHIEQCNNKRQMKVSLNRVDAKLPPYIVDLNRLEQIRQDTGTIRPVKRDTVPGSSLVARGILWEWMNDHGIGWSQYTPEVADYLEINMNTGVTVINLSAAPKAMPYTVDLKTMCQINNNTGNQRVVRRTNLSVPYTKCSSNGTSNGAPTQTLLPNGITNTSAFALSGNSGINTNVQGGASSGQNFKQYMTRQYLRMRGLFGHNSSGPASGSIPVVPGPAAITGLGHAGPAFRSGIPVLPPVPVAPKSTGRPTKRFRRSFDEHNVETIELSGAVTSNVDDTLHKYFTLLTDIPKDEDCSICCDSLSAKSTYSDDSKVYKLGKCDHMFHGACLKAMYESGSKDGSIQCPTCKTMYGVKYGNCPPGRMEILTTTTNSLPGYEGHGVISVTYYIYPGVQGPGHPHPGKPYSCDTFPRTGYFPDSDKGRQVVELLKIAWKRRIIFTVGTSVTSQRENTVVWNEIHHKTMHHGHTYPDPNYLDNVLLELSIQGVTEEDLD